MTLSLWINEYLYKFARNKTIKDIKNIVKNDNILNDTDRKQLLSVLTKFEKQGRYLPTYAEFILGGE